jgi:hypothetical protein
MSMTAPGARTPHLPIPAARAPAVRMFLRRD